LFSLSEGNDAFLCIGESSLGRRKNSDAHRHDKRGGLP
jgi:hypothetical protein